jgi:hypothetical protein
MSENKCSFWIAKAVDRPTGPAPTINALFAVVAAADMIVVAQKDTNNKYIFI